MLKGRELARGNFQVVRDRNVGGREGGRWEEGGGIMRDGTQALGLLQSKIFFQAAF